MLKEINILYNKGVIGFLVDTKPFSRFLIDDFKIRFFPYFSSQKIAKNEYLIREGDVLNFGYVIKQGEFEVKFLKSPNEVNNIIKSFGGIIPKHLQNYAKTEQHEAFFSLKRLFKVVILKPKEIIGLYDILTNQRSLFDVEVVSSEGKLFKLETFFVKHFNKEFIIINENFKSYIENFKAGNWEAGNGIFLA